MKAGHSWFPAAGTTCHFRRILFFEWFDPKIGTYSVVAAVVAVVDVVVAAASYYKCCSKSDRCKWPLEGWATLVVWLEWCL